MKVVIDTNVLVSGIFWRGVPYEILKAWMRNRFQLTTSLEILEEYQRVLAELANRYPEIKYDRILELVSLKGELVEAPIFSRSVCQDPDDDKFLAAALAGKASTVVTGDKCLLALDPFREVRVIRPSAFLKALSKGPEK